jgi:hypothetical protein
MWRAYQALATQQNKSHQVTNGSRIFGEHTSPRIEEGEMRFSVCIFVLLLGSIGASAEPVKQCLIVAPGFPSPPPPWTKWEPRGSFNIKSEDIKESYKEKDLKELHNKQGVLVLKIDPAGHQLESAQNTCKEFVK